MIIGLDIMGGDFAPEQAIIGLRDYLLEEQSDNHEVHFHLIGSTLR